MTTSGAEQKMAGEEIDELSNPPINRLVNREKQLERLEASLQNPQEEKRFLEWWGSPGIGKTQLIRLLIEKVCRPRYVAYLLVDFNTSEALRWADDPTWLLSHVAEAFGADLDKLQNEIDSFRPVAPQDERIPKAYLGLSRQARLYSRPEWLERLQLVRDEFLIALENVYETGGKRPIVFFFDETEYADPDLVTWLEEWVFSPLMQKGHYVIVWTARRSYRWARPEIQRNIFREQLKPFDNEGVQKQIEASDLSDSLAQAFFRKVASITAGHPAANAVVIAHAQQDVSTLRDSADKSAEQKLLRTIYRQFILGRVLFGLRQEEKLAVELLSLARFFDASILRRVLLRFDEKLFVNWSHRDFKILFERLKETQLLVWQHGFAIDPDFRYIIRDYYRVCKPDVFREINNELVDIHQEWLKRPVDNRTFFLMELLYHLASLQQTGKKVKLESALKEQLDKYSIDDREALRLALEKLAGEIENNTTDWLAARQRKKLVRIVRQFEESKLNE